MIRVEAAWFKVASRTRRASSGLAGESWHRSGEALICAVILWRAALPVSDCGFDNRIGRLVGVMIGLQPQLAACYGSDGGSLRTAIDSDPKQ